MVRSAESGFERGWSKQNGHLETMPTRQDGALDYHQANALIATSLSWPLICIPNPITAISPAVICSPVSPRIPILLDEPASSGQKIGSVAVTESCESAIESLNICLAPPHEPCVCRMIQYCGHGIPILFDHPSLLNFLPTGNILCYATFLPRIFHTTA